MNLGTMLLIDSSDTKYREISLVERSQELDTFVDLGRDLGQALRSERYKSLLDASPLFLLGTGTMISEAPRIANTSPCPIVLERWCHT